MSDKSSSGLAVTLLILLPVVAVVGYLSYSYNGIIDDEEEVFTAWSQVESAYQRRADLVPNLVKTVQAFADQEMMAVVAVTDARAEALKGLTQTAADAAAASDAAAKAAAGGKDLLDDEQRMGDVARAQKAAADKLTAVIVMAEAYPDLRSSDNFLALQDQLEGTENRINMARTAFNAKAGDFNARIRRIPGSLLAGLGGFKRKAYFKADEGADRAVAVEFPQPQ